MLARSKKPDRSFALVQSMLRSQEKLLVGTDTPAERLFSVMREAGFLREEFERCLSDNELFSAVTSVRQGAHEKHGVNALPTLFINEHKLVGNHDLKECEAIFAHYLDRKG